eukprot:15441973-Alexandrium_andersonii.AAC.1
MLTGGIRGRSSRSPRGVRWILLWRCATGSGCSERRRLALQRRRGGGTDAPSGATLSIEASAPNVQHGGTMGTRGRARGGRAPGR